MGFPEIPHQRVCGKPIKIMKILTSRKQFSLQITNSVFYRSKVKRLHTMLLKDFDEKETILQLKPYKKAISKAMALIADEAIKIADEDVQMLFFLMAKMEVNKILATLLKALMEYSQNRLKQLKEGLVFQEKLLLFAERRYQL
jgi:hypothetical protein